MVAMVPPAGPGAAGTSAIRPARLAPLYLADFDGKGRRDVCLDFGKRVVILDAQGRERASREPAGNAGKIVACADLDGDGRDELLFQGDDRLYALPGRPQGAVVPAEPRARSTR